MPSKKSFGIPLYKGFLKITFYFTSDNRLDFRKLVKDVAAIYKTRVEFRQIGVRDEARRLGGYGVCGRQLCCSSYIRDFMPITTQAAKDQNMSLNPSRLALRTDFHTASSIASRLTIRALQVLE